MELEWNNLFNPLVSFVRIVWLMTVMSCIFYTRSLNDSLFREDHKPFETGRVKPK